MNYGNPHQDAPTRFLPPLGNRGMGRERRKPVKMYPGGPPRSDRMYPGGPPRDPQMRPMTAGVDFGNRRPIYDRNGNLVPQRPVLRDSGSSTVPVPIMDYTGSMTAQAYKPGYPTEMDYLSDPFREIDPASLYFPENPSDNMNDPMDDDMYQGYGRGPLYFG